MPLRSDWSQRLCPVARAIDTLGDPWTLLVLRELVYGVHRYEDIRVNVEVSDKTLTERLERMQSAGLVERRQYSGTVRPRFEYHLTQAGRDTLPVLHALALWGTQHTNSDHVGSPFQIRCRTCDQESTTGEACSHCGVRLSADNVTWIRPTSEPRSRSRTAGDDARRRQPSSTRPLRADRRSRRP